MIMVMADYYNDDNDAYKEWKYIVRHIGYSQNSKRGYRAYENIHFGVISAMINPADTLFQRVFNLRRVEVVQRALKYFNLKDDASDYEINKAYRELCNKYNPKNGGDVAEFNFCKHNMAVIQEYKKEL